MCQSTLRLPVSLLLQPVRMLARSRIHRVVYIYILMHQSRNWLVLTDGIMHPGKIVAGSHSRGAELIRYICVDGCYACAEETGYPGAGGDSATTSTYHSKTTKTSSKSG